MGKSMKNMVLLAKLQTAVDVDPIPTGGANAILCRGLMPSLIKAEFVERSVIRGAKGNFGQLAVGVHREFEFEVEFAGAGTAGNAPKWAPLLKACGFNETLTAGTSAVYAPVSNAEPLITLYAYVDGLLFKMINSKGTVSFEMTPKNIPVMKFKFMGEYSVPTDTALPTGVDFSAFTQPATVGKINTPVGTIHGVAACISQFTFDVANQLVYRDLINCGGASSPDRKPSGNATFELTSAATKNWAELVRNGTLGALQLVHGTVPGNIVQVDMPLIQFNTEPTLQNENEIAMLSTGFSIQPNVGNDELILTIK